MRTKPDGLSVQAPADTIPSSQHGMALIGVMLIMSLMVMLALAVTFTAVSDHSITSNFKTNTKGFYAAEAGINNAHRMIHSTQFILASLPTPPSVTPGMPSLNPTNFTSAAQQLLTTNEYFPNDSEYQTQLQITGMIMPYPATDNNPAHVGNRIIYLNPLAPGLGQTEPYSVTYQLTSVGQGVAGLSGNVRLQEQGVVNFSLLAQQNATTLRVGSFSEFALYTDRFNPYAPPAGFTYQGFGPGDRYSGPVHTNQTFGFWSQANGQGAPVFNGPVTQSYPDTSFYRYGAATAPPPVNASSEIIDGVLVAPQFNAGFDRGVTPIPPAGNAFNQAEAVLDGGYSMSPNPPTDGTLDTALRAAGQLTTPLPTPTDPTSTTPDLPPGIYIPTDGQTFQGSGIYVMGNANQVVLTADLSGNQQTMTITQGNQTVTVTVNIDANTTTISENGTTTTLQGIPLDRSGQTSRPGASLYVYGNINSLTGPGRNAQGQPIPAIDSDFALTVTAGGYATGNPTSPVIGGNITITGDLTYETPVVDSVGNPINQNAANVLGIFASGGNISIPLDGRSPNNLTVDASMAAFALSNAQGNPIVGSNGSPVGGQIASDLSNWNGVGSLGNFTVVGGIQSSTYGNFGVYDGSMHGYSYQGQWDARYNAGKGPPFYPGYVVAIAGPPGTPTVTIQQDVPSVVSYQRIYNGTLLTGTSSN
jgi:Tfp pilus assembly protein PilX